MADLLLPVLTLGCACLRAWGDWFGARFPPSEAHTFSLDASLRFPPPDRLTVIYASSHTFMNHGSHYTLMGVFEAHDLAKIRPVHLLMVGDQDIKFAGDLPNKHEFFDITHMGDQETAMAINEMGAHILLDLTGYLSGTRLAIAALRPTPLCVHHFAQPSTMGAPDFVQSFLSDSIITPPEHQPFYTEALSYLPGPPKPTIKNPKIKRLRSHHRDPIMLFPAMQCYVSNARTHGSCNCHVARSEIYRFPQESFCPPQQGISTRKLSRFPLQSRTLASDLTCRSRMGLFCAPSTPSTRYHQPSRRIQNSSFSSSSSSSSWSSSFTFPFRISFSIGTAYFDVPIQK